MAKGRKKKAELIGDQPMSKVLWFLCSNMQIMESRRDRGRDDDNRIEDFELSSSFRGTKDIKTVIQALTSRGLLEFAPKKRREAKDRYRITEKGRRLAADSYHLFKWPAAQSRIRPVTYGGRIDCLMHLQAELTRLGWHDPERQLAPYQQTLLRDLQGGLDEEALAAMHDWWNYNVAMIANRGEYSGGGYGLRPAPPRIDVTIFRSSKDNLVVEWCPTETENGKPTAQSDWSHWRAEPKRHVAFTSRPSNELLFLHEIWYPSKHFPGMFDPEITTPERVMVDSILLQAAKAMVEELKVRLQLSFEVNMVTDIFVEWEEIANEDWPRGRANVLSSWRIENLARRKEAVELEEIEQFPAKYDCPLEVFAKALTEADAKKATGPTPSAHTKEERVTRDLKKAGYRKITLGIVRRTRELLERYRPDLVPRAPDAKVTPFRRPNGNGSKTQH